MSIQEVNDPGFEEFKKLRSKGITGIPPVSFAEQPYKAVAIKVCTAIPFDADVKTLNWNVEIVSMNGAAVVLSDFVVEPKTLDEGEQRLLSFLLHMRLPDDFPVLQMAMPNNIATSYRDLLWFQGHEKIEEAYDPAVLTRAHPGAYLADIGWYLPCRFADRIVAALGEANTYIFSGTLEDAMLYGVEYKGKKAE